MAELDRELPFGGRRTKPEDDRPKKLVDLLYAVLTKPSMLAPALMLMDVPLLFIAAIFVEPMLVAIIGASTLTLIVWALLRDRKAKRLNRGDAGNPEPDPTKKE